VSTRENWAEIRTNRSDGERFSAKAEKTGADAAKQGEAWAH
jgi:hypothetical protein